MPDLSTPLSSSVPLTRCPTLKQTSAIPSESVRPPVNQSDESSPWNQRLRNPVEIGSKRCRGEASATKKKKKSKAGASSVKSLEEYVKEWEEKKVASGASKSSCFLPFLANSPKMVECVLCHKFLNPGEEVSCSVRGCQGRYHQVCVKERLGISNLKKFRCPRHVCFVCKQKHHWRCARCIVASHDKCSPWPDGVIHNELVTGQAVCWRHPTDWRQDKENVTPATKIEEVFCRLPLPYFDEEFKTDLTLKAVEDGMEPPAYVHIRRNVYLVKKKRDETDVVGCTCSSTCSEDCVCRVQCISCTKVCRCSESCTNRPFRKEKKIKVVKTMYCGWGVEAAEPINKGEFIIEYVGEVINDALCEQRLWDMKYRGSKNFYMCELRKDFTIDATFKGNSSRFLNHSCDPNCFLEKWQVEGETRVGVFAARLIEAGEPLTYDYRFVQFGPGVKCYCGALNCQGFLGTKRNMGKVDLCWGSKRRRTMVPINV